LRLLIALQFLTVIPVRIARKFGPADLAGSMVYFPLIGAFLGLILAALHAVAAPVLPGPVVGVILTGALAALTGGLHLDGLADTADAFFSGKSIPEKLRIMKDSRIGAMGASAVCLVLMLKAALFASLDSSTAFAALLLAPVAGRYCLLLPAYAFRYGRDRGTGKAFIGGVSLRTILAASAVSLLLSAGLLRLPGAASMVLAAAAALAAGRALSKGLGGITGDTLGAVNELSEMAFLVSLIILR